MHGRFAVFKYVCVGILIGACADGADWHEIEVVDRATGRGIPLVELTTVDDVTWVTDSAGRVALNEPQLVGQTIFLKVSSPGYQVDRDGFGIAGTRLTLNVGKTHRIELTRTNIAERLYRITGRDRYLDSQRLGKFLPPGNAVEHGLVVGQDSVQNAVYRGKFYWFWGDTNRLSYPLGLFRTAGAVSSLPGTEGFDPGSGIELRYFTVHDGFARAMADVANKEGVVWIHGVTVVTDEHGQARMVCQYSRRRGLSEPLEQGHMVWNDVTETFEVLETLSLQETWRQLRDHPVHIVHADRDYLYFGNPFPVTRVPATLAAIRDREAYESLTCVKRIHGDDGEKPELDRGASGKLMWDWKKAPPVTQQDEQRWLKQGVMRPEELRFLPVDSARLERRILLHAGTVYYNAWRKKWVMIANERSWEQDSPSFLGEVYYAESDSPQGPFLRAVRIATHPGQSFYNPCQHPEMDQDGGRFLYFEGTYTNMFTKSPATPRYNYNQLMYRLDLSGEWLEESVR